MLEVRDNSVELAHLSLYVGHRDQTWVLRIEPAGVMAELSTQMLEPDLGPLEQERWGISVAMSYIF